MADIGSHPDAQRRGRTLYVGGVSDEVDLKTLKAAFLPFGDIVEVQIPMDTVESACPGLVC